MMKIPKFLLAAQTKKDNANSMKLALREGVERDRQERQKQRHSQKTSMDETLEMSPDEDNFYQRLVTLRNQNFPNAPNPDSNPNATFILIGGVNCLITKMKQWPLLPNK